MKGFRPFPLFLALYLLIGGLFPGMDFNQLVRTGVLFQHLQEHQIEANNQEDITLLHFLWQHFLEVDSHQHDGGRGHADLPFQQINSDLHFYLVQLPAWGPVTCSLWSHSAPMHKDRLLGQTWAGSIFRPPSPS